MLSVVAALIVAIMFANPMATAFTSSAGVQQAVSQATSTLNVNTAQPVSYLAIGISFAVLFAGTMLLGALIGFFLNLAFSTGMLGVGNRLLGAVFGFGRGFIFVMVIIFVVQLTPMITSVWWQHSQMVVAFQPAVGWLANIVSPNLANIKSRLEQTVGNMNSTLQNITK